MFSHGRSHIMEMGWFKIIAFFTCLLIIYFANKVGDLIAKYATATHIQVNIQRALCVTKYIIECIVQINKSLTHSHAQANIMHQTTVGPSGNNSISVRMHDISCVTVCRKIRFNIRGSRNFMTI